VDLEPVARDHDLFDHEPQNGLLGLEGRVAQLGPELLDYGLGAGDLPDRQLFSRGPGVELGLLMLHREDPLLDRRLARAEILEICSPPAN
jgi:hypothetical protein